MPTDLPRDEQPLPFVFPAAVLGLLSLLAIGLASMVDLFDDPGLAPEETVAPMPSLMTGASDLPAFVAASKAYLKQHARNGIWLNETFRDIDSAVKIGLFGHSPNDAVALGKDGFLFYMSDGLRDFVQGYPAIPEGYLGVWASFFDRMAAESSARDIPFLFALGPNKNSVYGEFLPRWLAERRGETRTGAVMEMAREHLPYETPDLRMVLAAKRGELPGTPLYHKTDTHWNRHGAALAMQAVFAPLGIEIPVPEMTVRSAGRAGDLARMLGWQNRLSEEVPVFPEPPDFQCLSADGTVFTVNTLNIFPWTRIVCRNENARSERLLVLMDSFGVATVPVLANTFGEVHFVWTNAMDMDLVDRIDPDIVLKVLVERQLHRMDPSRILKDAS